MEQYRTLEQLKEISESCLNGNWIHAAKECVEFGFYANDIINKLEEFEMTFGYEAFEEKTDIAILIEMTTELRNLPA